MAGYATSVRPYFHLPAAHENTAAHLCNIQPYCLLNHQIIDLLYTTLILVASRIYYSSQAHCYASIMQKLT